MQDRQSCYAHIWEDCLLHIDVCTDEHVIQEEDFALLRLEDLTFLTIDGLNQCLRQNQLLLIRVQLLLKKEQF